MRLYEHEDFHNFVSETAVWLRDRGFTKMREQVVEKDYYLTEVLRIVSETYGNRVIFKGGTSLSKGWDLIRRFSEDIDLFLNPSAFQPSLGSSRTKTVLAELRDLVGEHPGLTWVEDQLEEKKISQKVRADVFSFNPRFPILRYQALTTNTGLLTRRTLASHYQQIKV